MGSQTAKLLSRRRRALAQSIPGTRPGETLDYAAIKRHIDEVEREVEKMIKKMTRQQKRHSSNFLRRIKRLLRRKK